MYPSFTSVLNLSVEDLSKGEFILLEDNQTDGSFMLHHFISLFIKGNASVCLVGFAQTMVHYSTIGKKLGLNLMSSIENNQLKFIDGMNLFQECLETGNTPSDEMDPIDLRRLYTEIKTTLESFSGSKPLLLVLDDVSLLLNCGVNKNSLANFMHYCYALTKTTEKKLCLLSLVHCDTDVDDEDAVCLRDSLAYRMTIHIHVKGLETGYSRDVHGRIEVTRVKKDEPHIYRPGKIMQYKVSDRGVDFFPLGTSVAVL